MSISVSVSRKKMWTMQTGVFMCLIDEIRPLFKDNEKHHIDEICRPYDHEGMEFIVLDESCPTGFNLFYKYCKQVMENFPNTESGKQCMQEYIPAIQAQFAEVLRLMREDERYQEELQAA